MIVRAVNKFASEDGKAKMFWLIALAFSIALASCGSSSSEVAMNEHSASEVANEAMIVISKIELQDLKERAQNGELPAAQKLANYFSINLGDEDSESIRWQLQAARLGDCEYWADLMFLQIEEKVVIPDNFFMTGETLPSIGETNNCPKYKLQKTKQLR